MKNFKLNSKRPLLISEVKETCKKCKSMEEVLEALGLTEEELEEAVVEYIKNEVSMTAAAAPTATPHAFKDKKMGKKKIRRESVSAEDHFLKNINEATYRDFSSNTARGRIGSSIKEINRRLSEMEKIVNHATRLKSESDTPAAKYNTSTRRNFMKIKERMVNVIKGLKELES